MKLAAIRCYIRRAFKNKNIRTGIGYSSSFPSTFMKRLIFRLGKSVGIVCVPIVFIDVVGFPAVVVGSSMEPTLHGSGKNWWEKDVVWLSRFNLWTPKIGEIHTFIPPNDPEKRHIKRVTALDGDVIRLKKGPNLFEIPAGCCWMESDNPNNHNDSRVYGSVSVGLLTGRATHIIWPPKRWRAIKTEVFEHSTLPISNRFSIFGFNFPW
ncbi:unnamed protein product [Thelazia callipaeda]|uniref:Mitochondrial inner membrane protease subunit 2 n=1 Tax=Thelazia callipaeda TaxID=103827 RepID=A0A0N5CSG4_THECL|nr:unnamed protein product [Thelazia callipaeda]